MMGSARRISRPGSCTASSSAPFASHLRRRRRRCHSTKQHLESEQAETLMMGVSGRG